MKKNHLKFAFGLAVIIASTLSFAKSVNAVGHSCVSTIGYMCSRGSEYFIDHKWVDKKDTEIENAL